MNDYCNAKIVFLSYCVSIYFDSAFVANKVTDKHWLLLMVTNGIKR